jgi:hypothetical protein
MLDGYNRFFWQQAANSVYREIDVPDPSLGVDSAGFDNTLTLGYAYQPNEKRLAKEPIPNDVTQVSTKGWSPAVKPDDFPNTGYYGDFIQGW